MEYNKSTAKILIADENPAQRKMLKESLVAAGYRHIIETSDGEDTLVQINRYHPDIAVIDLFLSKLDGIGVLRNSKQINFAPDKAPSFIVLSIFATGDMQNPVDPSSYAVAEDLLSAVFETLGAVAVVVFYLVDRGRHSVLTPRWNRVGENGSS